MIDPDDLTDLSDEDLELLRAGVTRETDRRDLMASTPDDVRSRATFYVRFGGDPQVLHDAIDKAVSDGPDPQGA